MELSGNPRFYRWLAGGWMAFVVLLSFLPPHWKSQLHTKGSLHNAAHLVVFGVLAFLMARAAKNRDQEITFLFLAAVLGFSIEIAQDLKIVLPRDGSWSPVEWNDILVDVMAVVIAGIVQMVLLPALQRRPHAFPVNGPRQQV